jgi:DNA-binding transcriptional regulator YdaS (Cro superfamily)
MDFGFSNNVKIAVKRAGGATKVSHILGVSGSAVFSWIRNRKIPNIDHAAKLAGITGMNVRDLRPCQ